MKEQLKQIDLLLAELSVKGDDVFRLAEIRKLMNEVYKQVKESDE